MRTHAKKTAIISDIYDEDHYTLARNSGVLTDHPSVTQDDTSQGSEAATANKKSKNTILNRKNLMTIFLIFGSFATGGAWSYIVMTKKGTDN